MMPPEQLALLPDKKLVKYYQDDNDKKPLFLGHYWLTGKPLPKHITCVDYSAASTNGKLVAYRWSEESLLSGDNFIY